MKSKIGSAKGAVLDGQFIIETLTMWPLMLCPVAHPGKYRVEILPQVREKLAAFYR
jgi:hypothetical protein